jgi:hypothetical protein
METHGRVGFDDVSFREDSRQIFMPGVGLRATLAKRRIVQPVQHENLILLQSLTKRTAPSAFRDAHMKFHMPPVVLKRVVLLLRVQRTAKEKVQIDPHPDQLAAFYFSRPRRKKPSRLSLQCFAEDDRVPNVLCRWDLHPRAYPGPAFDQPVHNQPLYGFGHRN